MWNPRLDEAWIRITRRSINNLRCVDDTTLMAESEEELKSFMMRVKEEHEKGGFKLNIQQIRLGIRSHQLMANRWGKSGSSDRFYFLGLQKSLQMVTIPVNLKRCLLLQRKAMTNLDSVWKSRDIILLTKVHIAKTMVFPITYRCESWTIRKAEHWRINAFELWC